MSVLHTADNKNEVKGISNTNIILNNQKNKYIYKSKCMNKGQKRTLKLEGK